MPPILSEPFHLFFQSQLTSLFFQNFLYAGVSSLSTHIFQFSFKFYFCKHSPCQCLKVVGNPFVGFSMGTISIWGSRSCSVQSQRLTNSNRNILMNILPYSFPKQARGPTPNGIKLQLVTLSSRKRSLCQRDGSNDSLSCSEFVVSSCAEYAVDSSCVFLIL